MPRFKFDAEQPHLMNDTHYYLLKYLVDTAKYRGKEYCWPSVDTICKSIQRYGVKIQYRQAMYVLSDLVAAGLIARVKRHKRGANGMEFHSTLTIISNRAKGLVKRFLSRLSGVWNFKANRKKPAAKKPPADEYKGEIQFTKEQAKTFFAELRRKAGIGPPSTVPV